MASTRPFSPTARAFFAAHDDEMHSSKQQKKQSASIKKRTQVLGWRNRFSQDETYPIQIGKHSFTVRQVQRGEIDGTYGTGATVWPASMVLIKYLETTGLVDGKHVVDLGAGTGVTSIAAALLGAASCVCTDGEESVVRLSRDNIREVAHTLHPGDSRAGKAEDDDCLAAIVIRDCPISTQKYWWGTRKIDSEHEFDVVICSDCILPKLYPIAPLVEALSQILRGRRDNNAIALLSYEYRHFPDYDPKEKFIELCAAKGLGVIFIPSDEHHPVYSLDDVELWKVFVPTASITNDKSR